MQSAKFVDLNRTFVPINPNSFPTSMLEGRAAASPEDPIPVSAYEGQNFLPTAQGYRSYFGTTSAVEVDALPSKADYVFVFQNTLYENVIIALTETGIFYKRAATPGAWTQATTVAAAAEGVHYEWTYAIIAQVLYVYQANAVSYSKISSNLVGGITVTSVVPNFLNMTGQLGIFRAGGRLGFWDSSDSISWSNQDDYQDFTPSLLTLAGNVKFIDVNGRISVIKGYGAGFIIYSTKSIIYVAPTPQDVFQWKPDVIYSSTGITYPRQVVTAEPDTLHFAMTSIGLVKIEDAKPTVLVPDVVDAMKTHQGPIYLSLLEGRHLCLEVIDSDYFESQVQFTEVSTGDITYVFPGATGTLADAIDEELLAGTDLCATIAAVNNGDFAAKPDPTPNDKKPNTFYQPVWTAYFSSNGPKGDTVDAWAATPVATIGALGVDLLMCPDPADIGLTSNLTLDLTWKTVIDGIDTSWANSNWTLERFMALQNAIWDIEEENISAWLGEAGTRSKGDSTSVSVSFTDAPDISSTTVDTIGTYASKFSGRQWGMSKCSFFLTRYCVEAAELKRHRNELTDTSLGAIIPNVTSWRTSYADGSGYFADNSAAYGGPLPTLADAKAWIDNYAAQSRPPLWDPLGSTGWLTTGWNDALSPDVYIGGILVRTARCYKTAAGVLVYECAIIAANYTTMQSYNTVTSVIAYNGITDLKYGPVADVGILKLTGWRYTKNDNTTAVIPAVDCAEPPVYPKGQTTFAVPIIQGDLDVNPDGSFCSLPFEPVLIPGLDAVELNWPDQTVTLPAGTFLLQDGSIAPKYPTFFGFISYDLQLKKWGKYVGEYKVLVNYSPANSSPNGGISFNSFGILAGILDSFGKVRLFDNYPAYSYITYGKIGYYRAGMTTVEEVHANFSSPSTGFIKIDTSIEGRFVDPSLAKSMQFTDAGKVRLTGGNPGSWTNVTIGNSEGGTWNLNYLEFRGFQQGRR